MLLSGRRRSPAFRALIGYNVHQVALGVLRQVITAHELLVTVTAFEFLLARVCAFVSRQFVWSSESSLAVPPAACERFFSWNQTCTCKPLSNYTQNWNDNYHFCDDTINVCRLDNRTKPKPISIRMMNNDWTVTKYQKFKMHLKTNLYEYVCALWDVSSWSTSWSSLQTCRRACAADRPSTDCSRTPPPSQPLDWVAPAR